jgi:hypothetical protein
MGFTPRLPPGLFRSLTETHPRLRAAVARLEGMGIPRDRATALLRSLLVHVTEDLGSSYLAEMTARLRRIEAIRGRIAGAIDAVVETGALPDGLDHTGFSRLFDELQQEMGGLTSASRHAEALDGAGIGDRVVQAADAAPAPPTRGAVAPHPPETLAAAMDAARTRHPAGAAIIDRLLTSPEHGDRLGLALAADTGAVRTARLAELGAVAGLDGQELAALTHAVDEIRPRRSEAVFGDITDTEFDTAFDAATSPAVTDSSRPRIDDRPVPTSRGFGRFDIEDIPLRPGETQRQAASRLRQVYGRTIAENDAVRACWDEARSVVTANEPLTSSNYEELYNRTRAAFWRRVRQSPEARRYFEDSGFEFVGSDTSTPRIAAAAGSTPRREINISLDHRLEKAQGENWRRALDADNLEFMAAAPNTLREVLQARHPDLRQ